MVFTVKSRTSMCNNGDLDFFFFEEEDEIQSGRERV